MTTSVRFIVLPEGLSPLGLPHTLSRAPLRRRAPFAWLARALARDRSTGFRISLRRLTPRPGRRWSARRTPPTVTATASTISRSFSAGASPAILKFTRMRWYPFRTWFDRPRMPSRFMSPSIVDSTEFSVTPRAAATLAIPAVRQVPSACSRNSTGVGPWSLPTRTAGWSASYSNDAGVHVARTGAAERLDDGAAVGALRSSGCWRGTGTGRAPALP